MGTARLFQLTVLAAAVAGLGCATRRDAAASGARIIEVTSWSPPVGQECAFHGAPPPLAAFFDSAAAVSALEQLAPGDGAILIRVVADSTPRLRRWRRIDTTLPASDADTVESTLEALVRASPLARGSGRLLVRTESGRVTELTTGSSHACPPMLQNADHIRRLLQEDFRDVGRVGKATVWVQLDETGQVRRARIHRSSRDFQLDQAFQRTAMAMRFLPALIDRRPLEIWVSMILSLEPCPRRNPDCLSPIRPN